MMLANPPPTLARRLTIPQLARELGQARNTMWRKLLVLHAADRAEYPCQPTWLHRQTRGAWAVNRSLLAARHPELFNAMNHADAEADRVSHWTYSRDTRRQVNALYAALREHRREHQG